MPDNFTIDEFVAAVMARLPSDVEERELFVGDAKSHWRRGWTIEDAVAYAKCTEEVNPDLDEEIALTRMAKIEAKYTSK